MTQQRKRGRITLEKMFPVAKYLGGAFIAIILPCLPSSLLLMPGVIGSRAWMMLWVVVLFFLACMADQAWNKAYRKDLYEIEHKVKNGNLNRSTLLALTVPVLFLLDAAAIAHLYYAYLHSAAQDAGTMQFVLENAVMSVGVVLWIYGRAMGRIRYNSIWGIRSKAALQSPEAWQQIHTKAALPTMVCGAVTLTVGTFLSGMQALTSAVVCCCVAFSFMFSMKAGDKN